MRVCKEDEGVAICAGLSYCGKRALLLIQQTGLLDSINAVRGVAVEYGLPICMMVGLLEKEPGVPPMQSKRYGVRIVEPILDAMGIAYHEIEAEADVAKIGPAIDAAYAQSRPVVLLIGRRPSDAWMKRDDCLKALARHVTGTDIVLPVYQHRLRLDRHPPAPAQLSLRTARWGWRRPTRSASRWGGRTGASSCSTATAAC